MTTLTPSQLQTLRKTGSVRVVVKMEPQPDEVLDGHRPGIVTYSPVTGSHFQDIPNPLPSPRTIETVDGMRCEWVERGCK